jgi:hypothetical protein
MPSPKPKLNPPDSPKAVAPDDGVISPYSLPFTRPKPRPIIDESNQDPE